MKKFMPLIAGTMLSLSALASAQSVSLPKGTALPPPPHAGAEPAVPLTVIKDMTKRLAADDFEGRAPGSMTEPKVLEYIIAEYKKAGLQPGNKGQWLQPVPTVEIEGKNFTPLTISGSGVALSFKAGDEFVADSYRIVPNTQIKDSELVFVGYGINAPELGWNDYAGIDMKGKTAVVLVNDPDYAQETEEGLFKGRRMTYYGRWTYKFEEAARQGATAVLIVHDTFPAAYGWNVLQSGFGSPNYYVENPNNGMDQTQANGWIQKAVAETILKSAGKDLATLTAQAQKPGFKAVPLGLKASVKFDNQIRRATSNNVVGILPGKTRPDEYVLYSAHWDHLGHCTPDAKGDTICNGAVDNATGVAAMTGIAKMNADAGAAARSQVFIALTLEESGLLGSEYYAQNPIYPLAQTVGGVNMDALLPSGVARSYSIVGGDKSDLTGLYLQTLAARGLKDVPEEGAERGGYYRSDHFSFAKRGVPMFNVGRSDDLVEGGVTAGRHAGDAYTTGHYHAPSDEYSEQWDWSGIAQDTALFYDLGRQLAESTSWPNWNPTDEFRAIRDKDCAAATKGCSK